MEVKFHLLLDYLNLQPQENKLLQLLDNQHLRPPENLLLLLLENLLLLPLENLVLLLLEILRLQPLDIKEVQQVHLDLNQCVIFLELQILTEKLIQRLLLVEQNLEDLDALKDFVALNTDIVDR